MAKTLDSKRLALVFSINESSDVECRADYQVLSEDLENSRSLIIPLTAGQINTIKNFAMAVVAAIKAKESIV